ncbi:adenylyltransferase/cytidyltransferase family protein [Paramicrobacterium chengjingii]|uniref:adenylyltransferase/cytidyltransferase family protein n=1 Tax=Paramicrobacterium chengjingii TaxID=2769067 RepID=UPI0014246F6E|nr:adenylyltransferase/cytidyltransferase family protein [Microbacterium chengjingii]
MASQHQRVGYAPGAFDLFHIGHLNILRHARSKCDYLIAGVVSDEMLREVKGIEPVIPLVERLEIVRSLKFVDEAVVEPVPDKLDMWRMLRFNVLFKGDDWKDTVKGIQLENEFEMVGVDIEYFPYTVSTSSTKLRSALDAITRSSAPTDAPSDFSRS